MQQNISSVNITSKHYIDRLETDIVQLTRTLSIEHSIAVEDAKLMARKIMQIRLNGLLTKEELDGIKDLKENIIHSIKNKENVVVCRKMYELLKTFDLI